MEINKLSKQLDTRLTEAGSVQNERPSGATRTSGSSRNEHLYKDQVSVSRPDSNQSDEELARAQLQKLNQERFEKLRELKMKLQEFHDAKREVVERILETELGQKVESPAVMEEIARHMLDPASRL